jgi:large subunit ribosomal protein L24
MKPLRYYRARRKAEAPRRPKPKMHITKGDLVVVLSGEDKGKRGKVLRALPREQKVVVEGVNVVKRHRRARKQGEESAIVSFPAAIPASKVMLIDPKSDRPTRVRRRVDKDGTVERIAVRSGEPIPRNR